MPEMTFSTAMCSVDEPGKQIARQITSQPLATIHSTILEKKDRLEIGQYLEATLTSKNLFLRMGVTVTYFGATRRQP